MIVLFQRGEQRRQQPDYGYWYYPERNAEQQRQFFQVEVAPQALEAYFASVLDYPFEVSIDNFSVDDPAANGEFRQAVDRQLWKYQHNRLPSDRAQQFATALIRYRRHVA